MADSSQSIAIVGFSDPSDRHLADSIRSVGSLRVEEVVKPLSEINGRAVKLSQAHGVILFRTHAGSDADMKALQYIRKNAAGGARIVAMTEGTASLQSAHMLMRGGADAVLPDTVSAEELADVIQQSFGAVAAKTSASGRGQGRIISVAQSRGGVGATTVAVNLADALQSRTGRFHKTPSRSVAVVDFDLQFGAVAGFLDVQRNDSLYQLAREQVVPDDVFMEQSLVQSASGLSILPAPSKFAPLDAMTSEQVQAILKLLARNHDYVVVDLPRSLVDWISPVLEMSDRLLLVTDTAVPSIQQARRLIDVFTEDNMSLPVEIIVNFEKRPLVQGRHHKVAASVLERPLAHWLPPDPKTARNALDRGVPLSQVKLRSPLVKAFEKLGRRLATALDTSVTVTKKLG
ncbi:AAA family ATPase [Aliiruegeria lutimaris]|uniref:Pilus assembly protein CpaE n=1 Tax=Aliiruegeria lutimaris TaxID=571298 RepID=A0A1G9JXK0_9RHOB|nr:AAA family ATPase [Aliiruegeria lutimaris]SDL41946.1 pilus assembly protein CpaE [Aliiruegeria lutimaris]